jgi:hypothetical protein
LDRPGSQLGQQQDTLGHERPWPVPDRLAEAVRDD